MSDECTLCEDEECPPGGPRWLVDLGQGHGPQPYGPECVEIARGLAAGEPLEEVLDKAGYEVVSVHVLEWDERFATAEGLASYLRAAAGQGVN